jgi:GxxExxY protein
LHPQTFNERRNQVGETNNELLHADLTYRIRGVLFDVGNNLWAGLPEEDFQKAVSIGLAKRGIQHVLEEEFRVHYRDVEVGRYSCDITVGREVVLELKVVPELTGLHRAQIISYLRVTGADVGLLVNFGAARVEIERYAGFYAQRRPDLAWKPQVVDGATLLYPELIGRLYECLHRVHYELGPGFFHHVYRRALQVELNEQHISFDFVREIPVFYEGEYVSTRPCRLLIVDDKVVVAAFAVRRMGSTFVSRMRHYLDHFDKELGLLANFCGERLDVRPVRGRSTSDGGNGRWAR